MRGLGETEALGLGPRHWDVLGRLEKTPIGRREPDGSVGVRRSEAAGCFLYGPYLHLPQGSYRLDVRCRCGIPRLRGQPVLGIEVLVLSRFQQQWRDFTALELAGGSASLDFEVPPEHSLEGENEGRFEFRFFHFGNADLAITAVALTALPPPDAAAAAETRRWRLLGRLAKTWLGRRSGDGGVAVLRHEPSGCALYGGWPYLRLPRGAYRVVVRAHCGRPKHPDRPVLGIEVLGQSRWNSRGGLRRLTRLPAGGGIAQSRREISAAALAAGEAVLEFAVPTDMSMEAGADAPFDIRLHHLGNAALRIEAVDLVRLGPAAEGVVAMPRLRPSGRRKLVIVGNCQSETLRQGFARIESLNRLFDVKYHFIQLPKNLHEFAARDLESCDILLVQDINLWDAFPLRGSVRPGADVARFPLVRFASPWPFDAWNGPGDKDAHDREAPNLTFPYLDGLLGRLRRDLPDPEARFRAYRSLEIPGLVNYRRLHEIEVRRLGNMDKKFELAIGAFILDNFRKRRVFHTTVRPNWEVFSLLMQFVAKLAGANEPIALNESVDASLCNPQVPIHPRVARDLGIAWVDENTRYMNHGVAITWESYIRSYIAHYG